MADVGIVAKFRIQEGSRTLHLTHPMPEQIGVKQWRTPPVVKVTFNPHLVILENMVAGNLKGEEIAEAVRNSPRFKQGKVIETTHGDPLDPGAAEREAQQRQKAHEQALQDRIVTLTKAVDVALKNKSLDNLAELRGQIQSAKLDKFVCEWCGWRPKMRTPDNKKIPDHKQAAGLHKHKRHCKKKPKGTADVSALKASMDIGPEFPTIQAPEGAPDLDQVSTKELATQK